MAKTILFGGTFDPVHRGHLELARHTLTSLKADTCRIIPARVSPHKLQKETAAPEHRLAMLKLATESDPRLMVDDLELRRPVPPPSYTIDTLEALHLAYPQDQLIWLLGADQLEKLATWHRIHDIFKVVEFAVLARPGISLDAGLHAIRKELGKNAAEQMAQSVITAPLHDVSATLIRQLCTQRATVEQLEIWVPPQVARYIVEHQLYR